MPPTDPFPAPPLGLLLDVDGPIASPETRTIAIPSIISDLVSLAGAGVPVAFITGRSEQFVREQVVAPLVSASLSPDARVYGVCEKGAVWFPITSKGMGEVSIDHSVALPPAVVDAVRELVAAEFSDTMFFDETKQAMVSVEQATDVSPERYSQVQRRFNDAAFELISSLGVGIRFDDRLSPNAAGEVPFRIDATIISTDIESVTLDKDRAAERAVAYFAETGTLPTLWRSVGDSRGDYLMADHLHEAGHEVAHVDVRPSDGILVRPYRVIIDEARIHDDAGAEFLRYWVEKLGLA
jgi:hypothetical protein